MKNKAIDAPQQTFETQTIHAGECRSRHWQQSLLPSIAQTSTFVFPTTQDLIDYKQGKTQHPEYSRYSNPTTRIVEEKLATLEAAEDALLVGSGMAALAVTFLAIAQPGAHVILSQDHYAGTAALFDRVLARFGITYSLVGLNDWAAFEAAKKTNTIAVFTEIPTNPHLRVLDIQKLTTWAKEKRILSIVDATLATPYLIQPLKYGVDIVIHSATKFLSGHNDLLAGAVCAKKQILDAIRETAALLGPTIGPQDAYLLNRGLKTLHIRMQRHSQQAAIVAQRLQEHPKVERVFYPTICEPQLSQQYLPNGCGGLLSLRPKGSLPAARAFVDNLKLITHGASLGGVESLVQIPYLFSFLDALVDDQHPLPVETDLVRLSVGLEDIEDIWQDIAQALNAIS